MKIALASELIWLEACKMTQTGELIWLEAMKIAQAGELNWLEATKRGAGRIEQGEKMTEERSGSYAYPILKWLSL